MTSNLTALLAELRQQELLIRQGGGANRQPRVKPHHYR
jgi:hypothetical protein